MNGEKKLKTIVIHEVREKFFNAPLSNYNLTFDDGLYSQYYYWPLIKEIKSNKIFFIATNLIGKGPKREQFDGKHKEFPSCYESLALWRESGNNKNYMRLSELEHMISEGVVIGAHSHNHIKFYEGSLFHRISDMRDDIESMIDWFETNLGFSTREYAYPHYKSHVFLRILLRDYGFTKLYGEERIEIEKEKDILSFL
jgi:peptidoglycan/xylan/chitin deacetylase (PgdA/CDA1 family)